MELYQIKHLSQTHVCKTGFHFVIEILFALIIQNTSVNQSTLTAFYICFDPL